MKNIYLDNEYKCHVFNDGDFSLVKTDEFDGKCNKYIEGYRYIPPGEHWTRPDGVVFHGPMVAPWKDYTVLAEYQATYDEAKAEAAERIAELEVVNADQEAALVYLGVENI